MVSSPVVLRSPQTTQVTSKRLSKLLPKETGEGMSRLQKMRKSPRIVKEDTPIIILRLVKAVWLDMSSFHC